MVGVGDLILAGLDGLGLLAVDFCGLALHLVKDCNPVYAARPSLAGGTIALFAQFQAVGAHSIHFFHCVFLLVMEGRPWYNGRALVVWELLGPLFALVTVESGGRGFYFSVATHLPALSVV